MNGVVCPVVSSVTLSLVVPDRLETMATDRPTSLLNRVDLPTFGLPTIATTGLATILSPERRPQDRLSSALSLSIDPKIRENRHRAFRRECYQIQPAICTAALSSPTRS